MQTGEEDHERRGNRRPARQRNHSLLERNTETLSAANANSAIARVQRTADGVIIPAGL